MPKALHAALALGCLLACNCWLIPPTPEDLPEEDCVSCWSEAEFELDPTCELAGELTVEVGEGPDEFLPLAQGDAPEYYQGPQGGGHHYVAVRIGNVSPEHYDRVELTVDGYYEGQCPDDGSPCGEGWYSRTLVLGGGNPAWRMVDGSVEEYGIIVPLDGGEVIQAQVRDPCGREGWDQHRW